MTNIAQSIANLSRKNGKSIHTDETLRIINQFVSFNPETDYMESKDYTKLEKILAANFPKVVNLEPAVLAKELGIVLFDKTIRSLNVWSYGMVVPYTIERYDSEHKYSEWSETNKEHHDAVKPLMLKQLEILVPTIDKFFAMKSRLTKNGKLPKAEQERLKKEAIKGSLNPQLATALGEIKIKWIGIIEEYEINWYTKHIGRATEFMLSPEWVLMEDFICSQKGFFDVDSQTARRYKEGKNFTHAESISFRNSHQQLGFFLKYDIIEYKKEGNSYTFKVQDIEYFIPSCKQKARDEGESFYYKMADKMGGLLIGDRALVEVKDTTHGNTPFINVMRFVFSDDSSFVVENKIVINTSILGNNFYQYPCTFHNAKVKGVEIKYPNELSVKQAFLDQK